MQTSASPALHHRCIIVTTDTVRAVGARCEAYLRCSAFYVMSNRAQSTITDVRATLDPIQRSVPVAELS
ncbi:hypothetical protein [Sphaerobacter sp.]|uniref:hypothetical protein n=1 Tax=Sphaerobacter sp. TaxID=2099654 RepID=UPI001D282B16|nr:hypothetical protein [Sphaerobacter sp.]MBX5443536.1 hypothetical protein [Sphaerobacter sp.]